MASGTLCNHLSLQGKDKKQLILMLTREREGVARKILALRRSSLTATSRAPDFVDCHISSQYELLLENYCVLCVIWYILYILLMLVSTFKYSWSSTHGPQMCTHQYQRELWGNGVALGNRFSGPADAIHPCEACT